MIPFLVRKSQNGFLVHSSHVLWSKFFLGGLPAGWKRLGENDDKRVETWVRRFGHQAGTEAGSVKVKPENLVEEELEVSAIAEKVRDPVNVDNIRDLLNHAFLAIHGNGMV